MYMYISILWVRLSELGSNVTKLPPRVKGGVLCEAVAAGATGSRPCRPRPVGAARMEDNTSRKDGNRWKTCCKSTPYDLCVVPS